MITLENVNKIYSNGLHAVKDVNLKVNEGDIFGIIGLNYEIGRASCRERV